MDIMGKVSNRRPALRWFCTILVQSRSKRSLRRLESTEHQEEWSVFPEASENQRRLSSRVVAIGVSRGSEQYQSMNSRIA